MKKLFVFLGLALCFMAISPACSKSDDGGCGEAAVNFTSTPAINSTEPPAPGPDFGLTVNVTNIPAAGVTIEVSAKPEDPATAPAFYTETISSTAGSNDFIITNTPLGTSAIVTVTVTSKSCTTNTKTGSYRYSRK
ncbi:MAG TPA: hypothetical protein VLC28_12640 [Flavitalea sp.]|nr:hypothetical protein [Flavitalea sp.]